MRMMLISEHPTSETQLSLARAWSAYGEYELVHASEARVGTDVVRPAVDVVLWRHVGKHHDLVTSVLLDANERGARVMNAPWISPWAGDKLVSALGLARAGVPVVATRSPQSGWDGWGEPLVVKPAHGHGGANVQLCMGADILEVVQGMATLGESVVQPHVGPWGRDLRAYVVGGRCIALARRIARPGEWRANVDLGAHMEALEVSHDAARIAEAATTALRLDWAGVDLIDEEPWAVLEISGEAGWRHLSAATGVDVAHELVAWAVSSARSLRAAAADQNRGLRGR